MHINIYDREIGVCMLQPVHVQVVLYLCVCVCWRAIECMCYSCCPVWIWMDDNTGSFFLFNGRITAFHLHLIRQPRALITKRQICSVALKGNHQHHCVPPSAIVRSSFRTQKMCSLQLPLASLP